MPVRDANPRATPVAVRDANPRVILVPVRDADSRATLVPVRDANQPMLRSVPIAVSTPALKGRPSVAAMRLVMRSVV